MKIATLVVATIGIISFLLAPSPAAAHCDGLDGPVVTAARKALATGNVNLVLIWVQKANEPEIKAAFKKNWRFVSSIRRHGISPTGISSKPSCVSTGREKAHPTPD
jgi:hypothetical protein